MADLRNYYPPEEINRWRSMALGVGVIGLLAWAFGCFLDTEQALRSWLFGFIFWGGISIGSIGLLMLQYLTGGAWGVVIRRVAEAATRVLPLVALMFIPLAIGVWNGRIYSWTHLPPTDHVMIQRGVFMTPWLWIVRTVFYFVIFFVMYRLLNGWSIAQDKAADPFEAERLLEKASRFSGPGTVVFCLTVTFAVVDWIITLEPHWFSTIWGLLYVIGWALSALAFITAILAFLADKAPMDRILGKRHFHDLGKLMLALVMVWAYFNFAQYLVVWAGNVPEETAFYLPRIKGWWGYMGAFLILFHFAFPFLVLLQQDFKRRGKQLALIAIFILFVRMVDIFYQIGPSPRITPGIEVGAFIISWLDIVAPIAIGGLWLWWFFGELMKRPLVPINDPYLENAIHHGSGH